MYAYSSDSFAEFDARVVELLRRGLTGDILRAALRPSSIGKMVWSCAAAVAWSILRMLSRIVPRLLAPKALRPGRPPPFRIFSQTEAFPRCGQYGVQGNADATCRPGLARYRRERHGASHGVSVFDLEAGRVAAGDSARSIPRMRMLLTLLQPPQPIRSLLPALDREVSVHQREASASSSRNASYLPTVASLKILALGHWSLEEIRGSARTSSIPRTSSPATPVPAFSTATPTRCRGPVE